MLRACRPPLAGADFACWPDAGPNPAFTPPRDPCEQLARSFANHAFSEALALDSHDHAGPGPADRVRLTAFGVFVASHIQRMEGFSVVMQLLLFPRRFLSWALFPLKGLPGWLAVITRLNPLTYAVDPLRHRVFELQHMPAAAAQRFATGVTLHAAGRDRTSHHLRVRRRVARAGGQRLQEARIAARAGPWSLGRWAAARYARDERGL